MRTIQYAAFAVSLLAGGSVRAHAHTRESSRSDLSGRWSLNRELSENAQAKLERLHAAQGGRQGAGHGPGRHRPSSWLHVAQLGERSPCATKDE